jgi:hypothetical protein
VSSLKWGINFAIAALVISVLLGIIFDVRSLYIFLRAVIFTVVFFGLGFGLNIVINNFFPDLLYFDEQETPVQESFDTGETTGHRVSITLGNVGEYAVPEMYRNSPDAGELGNIEDLIAGIFKPKGEPTAMAFKEGIDRSSEEDYNVGGSGSFEPEPAIPEFKPVTAPQRDETVLFHKPSFTPSFGDDSDDLTALPDLGAMAGAFSSRDEGAEPFAFSGGPGFEPAPALGEVPQAAPDIGGGDDQEYNKGNKPQPLEGDFTAQELAKGISSILAQDK